MSADGIPEAWVCRFCKNMNTIPREGDHENCPLCQYNLKINNMRRCCCYHHYKEPQAFIDKHYKMDKCWLCSIPYIYTAKEIGKPGSVWRKEREAYKAAIIYDKPWYIPPEIGGYLQTERVRLLYKICQRFIVYKTGDDYSMTKKIRDYSCNYYDRVSGDMYQQSMIISNIHNYVNDEENTKNSIPMDISMLYRIDDIMEKLQGREAEQEKLDNDPNTIMIGLDKYNTLLHICTCWAFKYHRACNHLPSLSESSDSWNSWESSDSSAYEPSVSPDRSSDPDFRISDDGSNHSD